MGNKFDHAFITHSKEEIETAYQVVENSWATDQPFKTCLKVCGAENPDSALNRADKNNI
jgi:hypothetical protein